MTKEALRTHMRQLRAAHAHSASPLPTAEALLSHPRVVAARTVLLYHPLPDEVDTRPLLAALTRCQCLLPVVVGDDLQLRRYTGELSVGAFGILEPVGDTFEALADIDLVIVPGMAFTRDGRRLGRGRGYYDRLFPRLTSAYRLGLCHEWQLVDDIPTEPHDITMHSVFVMHNSQCTIHN